MDLNEKLIHFGSHYIYNSEAIYTYLGHNQAYQSLSMKITESTINGNSRVRMMKITINYKFAECAYLFLSNITNYNNSYRLYFLSMEGIDAVYTIF